MIKDTLMCQCTLCRRIKMTTSAVTPLPNVSKFNPYDGWDRGLFYYKIDDVKKVAKVESMTFITFGNANTPGILDYSIRVYDRMPKNVSELTTLSSTVIGPFKCLTRMALDTPIVLESNAIHNLVKGVEQITSEDIASVQKQGTDLIQTTTKGIIKTITTTILFKRHNGNLVVDKTTIEYTAKHNESTVQGNFEVVGDINPISNVINHIRNR